MEKGKIQIFVEHLTLSLLSLLKIMLLSRFILRFPRVSNQHEQCYILANGPSLSESVKQHLELFQKSDCLCVNFFAQTDYYRQIRPKMYVINAPEMWLEDTREDVKNRYLQLFQCIREVTDWDMILFVPAPARRSRWWQDAIRGHQHIRIAYYNTTPVEGFPGFERWAMDRKLGMPRPHNVLIPSILISIYLKYRQIFLLGADHSWLEDIWVNEHNEVLLTQKHFYDEKTAQPRSMHKVGKGKRRLDEVLIKFVYSFRGYFTLRDYATHSGVQILNATPRSFIDAFDRKKLTAEE